MKSLKVAIGVHGTLVFLEKFPDDEEHASLNEDFLRDVETDCDFTESAGIYTAKMKMESQGPTRDGDYDAYLEVESLTPFEDSNDK